VLIIGKFEMPHYVILRKDFEGGEKYVLHRHTIPSFIPLGDMCDEYLEDGVDGLERFALALHRDLLLLSNRMAIVTRLQKIKGVEDVKADEAVRLVEVATPNWTAKVVLQDDKERVVVIDNNNERLKDLERKILDIDGNNLDIVERIAQTID
jgi:Cenp-O kinetochore centromere component